MRHNHPAPTECGVISIVRCPVSTNHYNFQLKKYQPFLNQHLKNYYGLYNHNSVEKVVGSSSFKKRALDYSSHLFYRATKIFELLGYKFKQVNRRS